MSLSVKDITNTICTRGASFVKCAGALLVGGIATTILFRSGSLPIAQAPKKWAGIIACSTLGWVLADKALRLAHGTLSRRDTPDSSSTQNPSNSLEQLVTDETIKRDILEHNET